MTTEDKHWAFIERQQKIEDDHAEWHRAFMKRQQEIDDEQEDAQLDALMTGILVVALVCLCAFALGLIYQLAQPWVDVLIGAMK